jgi:zinc transporter ZupT
VLGLWLTGMRRRARVAVPFSAGVLLGVALFGLAPELAGELGWVRVLALAGGGYVLLLAIDRWVSPVCPTCAHDHDHAGCDTELHGFAAPLIIAAAAHSFLDGWSVATAQVALPLGLRIAVPLAVALHKLPEGVALGGILRASLGSGAGGSGAGGSGATALVWCLLVEGATLVGGAAGIALAPYLGMRWITWPLGFAAGWLFYLGWHAVHEEWKSRGAGPAFLSALTGMAGAAAVQRGAEALFR